MKESGDDMRDYIFEIVKGSLIFLFTDFERISRKYWIKAREISIRLDFYGYNFETSYVAIRLIDL